MRLVTKTAPCCPAELLKPTTTRRTTSQTPHFALRQRLLGSQRDSSSTDATQPLKGAHTLQAYCLGVSRSAHDAFNPGNLHMTSAELCVSAGCLGQYIEELLLCGQEVLPLLPPDAKACLMAIARRRVSHLPCPEAKCLCIQVDLRSLCRDCWTVKLLQC